MNKVIGMKAKTDIQENELFHGMIFMTSENDYRLSLN